MDLQDKISTIKIKFSDININQLSEDDKIKKCEILVMNNDCFSVAELYTNSVIHNFANNIKPGGPTSKFNDDGTLKSHNDKSTTQEDQIIARYKNNILLHPNMYPICEDNKINGEALLYSLCNNLHPIITLPSPIKPNILNKKTRQTIINRIHLMLYVSWKYKHSLITGLWGCGAFGADPIYMSELWKESIITSKVLPERIVFAIIQDNYTNKYKDIIQIYNKIKN